MPGESGAPISSNLSKKLDGEAYNFLRQGIQMGIAEFLIKSRSTDDLKLYGNGPELFRVTKV